MRVTVEREKGWCLGDEVLLIRRAEGYCLKYGWTRNAGTEGFGGENQCKLRARLDLERGCGRIRTRQRG